MYGIFHVFTERKKHNKTLTGKRYAGPLFKGKYYPLYEMLDVLL